MLEIIRRLSAELAIGDFTPGRGRTRLYRDPKINARVQLQAESRARRVGKAKPA